MSIFTSMTLKLVSFLLPVAIIYLVVPPAQAETYYFHNDQLGTPQVVTDTTQQVVWEGEYDPFGHVTETIAEVQQNIRTPVRRAAINNGVNISFLTNIRGSQLLAYGRNFCSEMSISCGLLSDVWKNNCNVDGQ